MSEIITTTAAIMYLVTIGGERADISIMVGHDCPILHQSNLSDCKSRNAAELSINGKVVGSIPMDGLSEEQIIQLYSIGKGYVMVNKKDLDDVRRKADNLVRDFGK